MKPVIYVSGPFSPREPGYDALHGTELNILRASMVSERLWRRGWAVLTPHKNTAGFQHIPDIPYETWVEGCLSLLAPCSAIFMMKDWDQSNGARIEHGYAFDHGILIFYEEDGLPSPAEIPGGKP